MRLLATLVALLLTATAACATDCSGTIANGGTAQLAFTTSTNPQIVMVMNNSANLMCISINGTPAAIAGTNCAAGSWTLQPGSATTSGGSYVTPPGIKAIYLSIVSASTGDRYSCERQ